MAKKSERKNGANFSRLPWYDAALFGEQSERGHYDSDSEGNLHSFESANKVLVFST